MSATVEPTPIFEPAAVEAAVAKRKAAGKESKRRRDRGPAKNHLPWEAPPDMAHRLSVPELVAVYEKAERDIREGFAIVARAEKSLNAAFTLGELHGISVNNGHDGERVTCCVARLVPAELLEQYDAADPGSSDGCGL